MNRFLLSTPGLIITGIGSLSILWLISKLLGASFLFICGLVIVALLLLIAYLVLKLYEEPLLEKLKSRMKLREPEKEEEI